MRNQLTQVLATAALAATALCSCGGDKQQSAMPAAKFKTMKVERRDITLSQNYSATIRGRQDIEVYPQVGGTLEKLCVTEGQSVRKGQTLFVIDQVPYRAALNTAEATLKSAQAQEATARLTYESKKTLFDQQVVSEFDLQTAHNALLNAKAGVAQATAQVVNARNSLGYTSVKSPADGVVGTLPYRQGALVGSSMPQPLTTVSDNSQMYVYFSITEAQLLQLSRQSGSAEEAVKAMPQVSLKLVDGSEYGVAGKVESVSGVVDRNTGSVQLRAAFDNPGKLLHSGSTGSVTIPVPFKDQIVIPVAATVQSQDKYKVYTVDAKGVAHEKLVTLGAMTDGKDCIVTSGLEAGEQIVAEGAGMVKDGQTVK